MIKIFAKNEIIVKYRDKSGIKTIAKELGISRNTVRHYVREYEEQCKELNSSMDKHHVAKMQATICSAPQRKNSHHSKRAFTKVVENRFLELIKINEERNLRLGTNKQQLTATLLWKTLTAEGYKISDRTIRDQYRLYKQKNPECFIKQYYEYGQRAEYDFHEIKLIVSGVKKEYHQATFSLPKSNTVFGILYKNEKMEVFLDSIVKFIELCDGVPKEIVFDNMSNVVKRWITSGDKELTADLLKLSTYYGFYVNTTNPRSGNEKGHVENSGKNIRRDIFCLKYEFDSEEELFAYYEQKIAERNEPFLSEFMIEKEHFLPKPLHNYQLGHIRTSSVNTYGLISVDSNFYSVPDSYVNQSVTVNVYVDIITIYNKTGRFIAQHNKKNGKGEYSIDIYHYINTFLKKPGALKNSLALHLAPKVLQTIFTQYFTTDPKKFLHFLLKSDVFDNIDEIAKDYGYIKKGNKNYVNPKYLGLPTNDSLEDISLKQILSTSLLFDQKEENID